MLFYSNYSKEGINVSPSFYVIGARVAPHQPRMSRSSFSCDLGTQLNNLSGSITSGVQGWLFNTKSPVWDGWYHASRMACIHPYRVRFSKSVRERRQDVVA